MKAIINAIRSWFSKPEPKQTIKRADFTKSTKTGDVILRVVWSDGRHRGYYGSGTVWHHYPMMWDIDRDERGELIRVYRYLMEFGNPYPTANDIKKCNT